MTVSTETAAIPDAPDGSAAQLSMVSGNPTPEELAAVTAVITAMLEEVEDRIADRRAVRVSAWQRSQRPIRVPLSRGLGAWRGFSG